MTATLDATAIAEIIDMLLDKLKHVMSKANIDGVVETFNKIPDLRDNMVNWVLEAMAPGSPEWKTDAASGVTNQIKAWADHITNDILGLELPGAPFTPENAVDVANKFRTLNIGVQSAVTIISIIVEIASLGQIDQLHTIIDKIDNALGLSRVGQELTVAKFYPALITPIRQYYNKQFPTQIPGANDLVNFVVRESFPLEDLPDAPGEFAASMLYHGFSAEWSKAYWHSHWRLVAVGDLYEMLHRKEITIAELQTQLVLHDYRPEWTERLVNISYRLIPRVDLRRAWELGEIDTLELARRMELVGYSPFDAVLQAKIQIKAALTAEIGKIIEDTRVDFLDGAITEDTARGNLLELGLHSDVVDFRMADFSLDYKRKRRQERIANFKDGYQKDLITIEELESFLTAELTSPEVIENILEDEWIKKFKKPKEA